VRYVGVSSKAYLGYRQSLEWMRALRAVVDTAGSPQVQPFVAPAFPLLESAVRIFAGSGVWVGAQTSGWDAGPYTGEVPPSMLVELGVRLVEVGHLERRRLAGETADLVRRKTTAVREAGLTALLCVGETERVGPEQAAAVSEQQVREALDDDAGAGPVGSEGGPGLMVAYEPGWAIGAPDPAPPEHADEVLGRLRAALADIGAVPLLYGGAAGPGLLGRLPAADGLFLGRYAHDASAFGTVLAEAEPAAV
jgi:triosephosphate isomerase